MTAVDENAIPAPKWVGMWNATKIWVSKTSLRFLNVWIVLPLNIDRPNSCTQNIFCTYIVRDIAKYLLAPASWCERTQSSP
jgi:hypothetical protein